MRRVGLIAASTVALLGAFLAGQLSGNRSASAAIVAHSYTLRMGDRAVVPSVGQICTVEAEAGLPELFCARPQAQHHQVVFFKSNISVWKVGNPDAPVWWGKP